MTGTILRAAPRVAVVAVCAALLGAGCGSSGSKASNSTAAPNQATVTTGNAGATATTTGSASATTAASGTKTLPADICTILDVKTVSSTLNAPEITSTRSMGNEDNEPSCLWGNLGPSTSAQVTAFTGSDLATKKTGWSIAFPKVSGAGNAAWSRGVIPIGANKNVVLYVDYGDFGLQFSLGGPNVNVDQAVALANAIK